MSNFGVFASPERHLVFDVNDFDETAPGPFEWDIKRLAREPGDRRAREWVQGKAASLRGSGRSVSAYREAMRKFAVGSNLEVWYAHLDMDVGDGLDQALARSQPAPSEPTPPWPRRAPKTVRKRSRNLRRSWMASHGS